MLFSNVAKYGYEDETAPRHVEVGLALENDRMIIEFVDDGRPFDPLTTPRQTSTCHWKIGR